MFNVYLFCLDRSIRKNLNILLLFTISLVYGFILIFFIVEIDDNRSFIEFAWEETGDSSFLNWFANDAIRGCEASWVWQILIDKAFTVI